MGDLVIPGLAPWMSEADYHADVHTPVPSLSSTIARVLINQSPRHAWWRHPRLNAGHESRHSEAFDIGKAAHAILLGKGAGVHVIDAEDWRGKEARKERDDARAAGMTPMLAHQHDDAMQMVNSIRDKLRQLKIEIEPGRTEIPAFAEIDGVLCRAMIDCAPSSPAKPLFDLKTCEDASPEACIRAATTYGLDFQVRWYQEVWHAATGEQRKMRLCFVEKTAPYEVSVVELMDDPSLDGDWMMDAASKAREARFLWRRGLETGQWPGYPAKVARIEAPIWHRKAWADRAVQHTTEPKPTAEAVARATAWQSPEGITA